MNGKDYTPDDVTVCESLLDDIRSSDKGQLRRAALIQILMDTRGLTGYPAAMLVNEWANKRKVVLV